MPKKKDHGIFFQAGGAKLTKWTRFKIPRNWTDEWQQKSDESLKRVLAKGTIRK